MYDRTAPFETPCSSPIKPHAFAYHLLVPHHWLLGSRALVFRLVRVLLQPELLVCVAGGKDQEQGLSGSGREG